MTLLVTLMGIRLWTTLSAARADVLDVWLALDTGYPLWADAWGNGTWVGVGDGGTIVTSTDGVNRTRRTSGTTASLNSVVVANGRFVAVGESGTILTSDDGINWTLRNSGTTEFIFDVNYGQGKFIAAVATRKLLTSTNGIDWDLRTAISRDWYGVAYGGGKFVAVGGITVCVFARCRDSSVLAFSADGEVWSGAASGGVQYYLSDVAFGNGMFVAVGDHGSIVTSTDGESWTSQTSGSTNFLYNVAYGDGTFLAVGVPHVILSSTNGVNWTDRFPGASGGLVNVAYGDGRFVAVGTRILRSRYFGPARLSIPNFLPDGSVEMPVLGKVDQNYRLQATAKLYDPAWSLVKDFTQTNETQTVVDSGGVDSPSRFYRVVTLP